MTFNRLKDGLGGEEVRTGSLAGAQAQSPYFTGSMTVLSGLVVTQGGVTVSAGGANVTGSIVSSAGVESSVGLLSAVGTGSPTVFGKMIQAGSGATGAGSDIWVSYGTAYSAVPPSVVVSHAEGKEAIFVEAGSIVAGSFYVQTVSASQVFTWISVGAA